MTFYIRLFFLILTCMIFSLQQSVAAAAKGDQAVIKQAENYLNALHMAKAHFIQTTPQGQKLPGTFYLNRPGKLRFVYDPPVRDFIVADGILIYFYDADMGEQSNAPISQSLGDFILRKHISLSGELKVTNVQTDDQTVSLKIVQTADPAAGSLTLTFGRDPFVLKKWVVVDSQNLTTSVELSDLQTDVTLPPGLFVYVKPKSGKTKYN